MLEFAELACERGGLERYGHVSTAYVAGTHRGPLQRIATTTSGSASTTPTSSRSSRPSGSSASTPACRSRSCARASSSATAAAAGRPRSMSSTGRCGRSRADCSRRCRRSPRRRSTSSRSTTSPTRSTRSARRAGGIGETYHLTAGVAREHDVARSPSWPAGTSAARCRPCCSPAEFAALEGAASAPQRSALEGSRAYFPYFAIGTVFDEALARARLDPAGIHVSPLRDYLERLLDFATRSRWGKRPIARAEAFAPSTRLSVRRQTLRVLTVRIADGCPPRGGCRDAGVAAARAAVDARPMALLADTARFRADDPDALVHASLACPLCLRSDDVRVGGGASTATIRRCNAAAPAARSAGACTWHRSRRCASG